MFGRKYDPEMIADKIIAVADIANLTPFDLEILLPTTAATPPNKQHITP